METTAYKILSDSEMEALEHDGVFAGAPVDLADGYVHLSTCTQLQGTVDKHFAGRQDLWIAAVDLDALGDAVKWEVSRGGELFPHLYAPLPLSAITAYSPIHREEDGTVRLPVTG
ncbi:DUF952 domain-containing protein [Sphingomonas sp. G-3-2-10]|uniref:DUF952 domain-containing protein n=1 Tax=Sphingomonas sp. G-3-2-10 TaxID=2728838 RepID=UPI00146B3C97|nr:DUF952 domain-containing protein [Sphingomonas sp. G-3-2-10]NML05375.1 DUF952 domain-containing protein [Sphingomonas sp. G-3-2-10]